MKVFFVWAAYRLRDFFGDIWSILIFQPFTLILSMLNFIRKKIKMKEFLLRQNMYSILNFGTTEHWILPKVKSFAFDLWALMGGLL